MRMKTKNTAFARRCWVWLWFAVFAVGTGKAAGEDFFVSPDGRDDGPGTATQPFRTLVAARGAVRNSPRHGVEPITVWLRTGTYYLESPVVLEPSDSGAETAPIVLAAVAGEKATISGGLRLELIWRPASAGVWRATVPADLETDQLFLNGLRQQLARYPNYDPDAQYFHGVAADCFSPQRAASWRNPAGGLIHAMHRSLWGDFHYQITGKDGQNHVASIGGWQNNRPMGMHDEYRFVENIKEELDAPGEWYLDRDARELLVYPPAGMDLTKARVEAVRLKHLFEFRGSAADPVRHIHLRNLTLTHTARTFMENKEPLLRSDWTTYRGGAIVFDGTEDCSVDDCLLDQVGGNAIFVNNYNRRLELTGNQIVDAGASGISFVGDPAALRSPLFQYSQTQSLADMDQTPGPRTPNYPAECLAVDNLIRGVGRVEKQTAGVNVCMASRITIRQNSIYDTPRAGINICDGAFGGHLIEGNDVFDTVLETGDHGAFNSWGRDRFWHPDRGQTEQWVAQHPDMPKWDCVETNVLRYNRWRCDHGWDIDLDDGSSNYEIYGNLCLAGGIKLREGYFRRVHHNVLVDYTFCPHVWYANCHTQFEHNIVWRDEYAAAGMAPREFATAFDFNFVHVAGASTIEPAVGLQQASGNDQHSLKGDAEFVNPLQGDYRLKSSSPARTIGCEDLPMEFGVRKPALRALAKTPPLPGTLAAAGIRSGGWGRPYGVPAQADWLGARVRNITTAGELSAVGLGDPAGVLVLAVAQGQPAAEMGLRALDVVRELNGVAIADLQQFSVCFQQTSPGSTLQFTVWRNQQTTRIEAVRP